MSALAIYKHKLSDEEKKQHYAVVGAALHNVRTTIDSIGTLPHKVFEEVVTDLQSAERTLSELNRKPGEDEPDGEG